MKKILFLLFVMLLFLASCNSGEVKSFASDFNKVVNNEDIDELNPDKFGEIEGENKAKWQTLYESEAYTIEANYEDGKKLSGYTISIESSEPYEQLEGKGYEASIAVAKVLGLDPNEFINHFETELEGKISEDVHSYLEDDYEVVFVAKKLSEFDPETGLSILFKKVNQ
ncbi:hypothetical protein [Oceanobacillus jeddahense]|uniref:Lipoprotein n=1 Tax=Oceanobacillus jeddahense TaxID=1462527 RepID=A0ABY5JRB0_9BACI|nr:hypothetical protein [Oceanobacillus jeddahense]UUI01402.1 hypothetical protein NP439_15230 [Oceanobacillus jeddahense]